MTLVQQVAVAQYTVLGWAVTDISGELHSLEAHGVTAERFEGLPQDEQGIWTAPGGDKVAWFRDPDGNLLSLTQTGARGSEAS